MALWEDRKRVVASIGVQGLWGHISFFLGIIFAVIGVIGDATNVTLGLEPMSWFLLAIVASLLALPWFIGWFERARVNYELWIPKGTTLRAVSTSGELYIEGQRSDMRAQSTIE